jgi:hypothetical protein
LRNLPCSTNEINSFFGIRQTDSASKVVIQPYLLLGFLKTF